MSYKCPDCQKLICEQVLTNDSAPLNNVCQGIAFELKTNSTFPPKTIHHIHVESFTHAIASKINHLNLPSLPLELDRKAKQIAKTHSNIAEVNPETENPYLAPLIAFLGVCLITAFILFSNSPVSYSIIGGLDTALLILFAGIGTIVFLILLLSSINKTDYTQDKVTSYSLGFIFSLLSLLTSFLMLSSGTSTPAILVLILTVMLIVFLVKWIISLKQLKGDFPKKSPDQKKYTLIQTLLFIGWLAGLIFVLSVSWDTGILITIALIIFAVFFIFWLLRLNPKDRETAFFICFLLATIFGLSSLPSVATGLFYIAYFVLSAGFLLLWMKNLKYWKKPKTD